MFPYEGHIAEFTQPQNDMYPYSCCNPHRQFTVSAGEGVKVVVENIPKSVSVSELLHFFNKFPFVLTFFCIYSEANEFEGLVSVHVASFEMAHILKSKLQGRYCFNNQLLPLNVFFPKNQCSPRAFHNGDRYHRLLSNNDYLSSASSCVSPNTDKTTYSPIRNSNNDRNNRGNVVSVSRPFPVNPLHSNNAGTTLSCALSASTPDFIPHSLSFTPSSCNSSFTGSPSCLCQGESDPLPFCSPEKGEAYDGVGSTKEGPPGSNLFIYHLPATFSDYDLCGLFHSFGKIVSAKVIVDLNTQMSRGYGFVSFDNPDAAQMAIDVMNGYAIGKKKLKVQLKFTK